MNDYVRAWMHVCMCSCDKSTENSAVLEDTEKLQVPSSRNTEMWCCFGVDDVGETDTEKSGI